jgi:Amt family ammonium transporter
VLGLISGGIAGLAAITPAAGYVDASGAMVIGLGAGVLCYGGILVRKKMGFDDALDVWGVHGVAGTFGALMIGLLATSSVNDSVVSNGLLYGGDATLLGAQATAVAVVWAVSFAITFILLKVIGAVTPLRMTKEEERIGADLIQHGETAYS